MVGTADVVVETFEHPRGELAPAATMQANPRLVHCSITGYGGASEHRGRPVVDSLVSARLGLYWETRGVPGTTIGMLSGFADPLVDLEFDADMMVGPARPGPMYMGIPWVSNAAAYLATIAVTAALRAWESSGRGQHVSTSLLQGALCASSIACSVSSARRVTAISVGRPIHGLPRASIGPPTAGGSSNGCSCRASSSA